MVERGWKVITLDIEPSFAPDIIADVTTWQPPQGQERPLLVWCSPPCTEFAREFMPWCKTGIDPDMSIVLACMRIIKQLNPLYWVIENVRGAIKWFTPVLGSYKENFGPFFLWGYFPLITKFKPEMRKKESYSSTDSILRGAIPYQLSLELAIACENTETLF